MDHRHMCLDGAAAHREQHTDRFNESVPTLDLSKNARFGQCLPCGGVGVGPDSRTVAALFGA